MGVLRASSLRRTGFHRARADPRRSDDRKVYAGAGNPHTVVVMVVATAGHNDGRSSFGRVGAVMRYRRSGSVVFLWVLAAVWFVLCVAASISIAIDPSMGESDRATTALGALVVGVLPGGGVLWHDKALERRFALMTARAAAPPMPVRPRVPPPAPVSAPRLPPRLQPAWNRLAQAWTVVTELQRQGWVDADSTRGLPQSMARLHQLGVADGMTDHLGGRQSNSVEQQIGRLADLLVALADEAVEHQATIGAGDFTPATLAAAAQRLAADSAAYRELMELSGTWAAPPA